MSTSTEGLPVPQWDLGDRLAKALKVADISAQDMADYLEKHRNTVSAWMNGRGKAPDRPILIAWALRTGVPFEWLRDGTVPAGPSDPDGGVKNTQPTGMPPRIARAANLHLLAATG